MKTYLLIASLSALVAACATPDKAGVRNPEFFRQVANKTLIESSKPYTDVASCFEETAALLPMSSFIQDEEATRTTYRLRGFGYTFEEIDFEETQGGSRITTFIAPNLNDKWLQDFARDRGAFLSSCAGV